MLTQWQGLIAGQHSEQFEVDQIPVDFPDQDIDQSSSDVITVNMPLHHELVQFDWVSCKYSKMGSKNASGSREMRSGVADAPGSIVVRWENDLRNFLNLTPGWRSN